METFNFRAKMIDGALSCNGAVLDTSLHRMAVTSSKS